MLSGAKSSSLFDPDSPTWPIGCCVIACDLEMRCWDLPIFDRRRGVWSLSFCGRRRRRVGYITKYKVGVRDTTLIVMSSTWCCDDMAVSVDTALYDTPHSQFHRGYYIRARDTLEELKRDIPPKGDLLLVGHSLGGALVGILTYLISLEFPECSIRTITLGCPKYASLELELWFKNRKVATTHYLNDADPIIGKPLVADLARIGREEHFKIDTGNDNINHGLGIYKLGLTKGGFKQRRPRHTLGHLLSRIILDILS